MNSTIQLNLGSAYNPTSRQSDLPQCAMEQFLINYKIGEVADPQKYGAFKDDMNEATNDGKISLVEAVVLWPKMITNVLVNPLMTSYVAFKKNLKIELDPQLSYLKIPMIGDKRGGGCRVKRILFYDKGIESGNAAIYGNEYIYENENGSSSGVATNEPGDDETNSLIEFLPRLKQSLAEVLLSGSITKTMTAPVSESILPGPSIGYSRLVVRNINDTRQGSGYSEYKYYTCKDYPYDMFYNAKKINGFGIDYSDLNDMDNYQKSEFLSINLVLLYLKYDRKWFSQGFRFIKNNMHGQMKSVSKYRGNYKKYGEANGNGLKPTLISRIEYEYYQPGEELLIWDQNKNTHYKSLPGKEMEIAFEKKHFDEFIKTFKLEFDLNVLVAIPPVISISLFPYFALDYTEVSKYASTKVVDYPSILKKTIEYSNGVTKESENLAYDPYSGDVLLSRYKEGDATVFIKE